MGKTVESSRLASLDGLRGLAAVVVLVHHTLLLVPGLAAPYFGQPTPPGLASILVHTPLHLAWAGTEAVFLFFVLSGLVLARSAGSAGFSWAGYFPSRIVRLYLPVAAGVLFALAVILLLPRTGPTESAWLASRPDGYTPGGIVKDLILIGGSSDTVSPLWSLQWEVLFSLLLPVYLYASRRMPVALQFAICIAASVAGNIVGNTSLKYLPMFGLGVALAAVWDRIPALVARIPHRIAPLVWTLFTLACLVVAGSWWYLVPVLGLGRASAVTLGPVLLAIVGLVIAAVHAPGIRTLLSSRLFRRLGAISFSLYLVHEPLVIAVGHMLPHPEFALLLTVPVSLAVAWAFQRLIELPAHRLARRVRRDAARREQPAPAEVR
ncbi:acyltransferase family protein [Agromyces archimandritae]|uniref:Acyltransferase n=1 Tax=Agromyces archimandritae TaxID=2781962 RepID=A0A975FPI7_9MICO|nr:acyltransferase [Agromyces archimandritae]QTX05741.1 acyltransferase [Agromyces archimandritae]